MSDRNQNLVFDRLVSCFDGSAKIGKMRQIGEEILSFEEKILKSGTGNNIPKNCFSFFPQLVSKASSSLRSPRNNKYVDFTGLLQSAHLVLLNLLLGRLL